MQSRLQDAKARGEGQAIPPEIWAEIQRAISSLQYGTIQVTVHGSKVVQIERNEKVRFDR